jgi:hypothetical protein
MNEIDAVTKREQDYEVTNCTHDSSYFINKFLRVEEVDGPRGVMLDTPKEELVEIMENEQLTIGRYPRVCGKTTTLVGFAIHKALFLGKTVLYSSVNAVRRIGFLREVSYSYRNLPTWMQKPHREGPEGFWLDDGGRIRPITAGTTWDIEGIRFDYIIFDEIGGLQHGFNVDQFIHATKLNKAKMAIVGTFKPDAPVIGKIWSDARLKNTGWASLPSFNEEWKVETVLSLSDKRYSEGY